jgi:hypothetical protein
MVMVIITETMTVIGRGATVVSTIGAAMIGAIMVGAVVIVKNCFELKAFQCYEVFRGFCPNDRSPSVVSSFRVKLHVLMGVASR